MITERVAQGGGRHIRQLQVQPSALRHPEQALDNVRFDGDQQHFQFAARCRAQDLVVPHDFLERKGHVLLRLVLDDLCNLAGIDGRQFYELREDVKSRRADVDAFGLDAFFSNQLLQGLEDGRFARGLLCAFRAERLEAVLLQPQTTGLIDFKLGQLEAACPKIDRQK